jgi:TRAM1-like protein
MKALSSGPVFSRVPGAPSSISTMPILPHKGDMSGVTRARTPSNTIKPRNPLIEMTSRHKWIIPGAITLAIFLAYLSLGISDEKNVFRSFVRLSYPVAGKGGQVMYGKGLNDLLFVSFYGAFFTFLRVLIMEYVLSPLSDRLGFQKSKKTRFIEQCLSIIHYSAFGLYGLV